jgi:hypothetical protein
VAVAPNNVSPNAEAVFLREQRSTETTTYLEGEVAFPPGAGAHVALVIANTYFDPSAREFGFLPDHASQRYDLEAWVP